MRDLFSNAQSLEAKLQIACPPGLPPALLRNAKRAGRPCEGGRANSQFENENSNNQSWIPTLNFLPPQPRFLPNIDYMQNLRFCEQSQNYPYDVGRKNQRPVRYRKKTKILITYPAYAPTNHFPQSMIDLLTEGQRINVYLQQTGCATIHEIFLRNQGETIRSFGETLLSHSRYQSKHDKPINSHTGDLVRNNGGLCYVFRDQPEYLGYIFTKRIVQFEIPPLLRRLGLHINGFFSEKRLFRGCEENLLTTLKKKYLMTVSPEGILLKRAKLNLLTDILLTQKDGTPTSFFKDLLYYYHAFRERKITQAVSIIEPPHAHYFREIIEVLGLCGIHQKKFETIVISS